MRGMKNKKLKNILSVTGYFLLVVAICVSASIVFHNTFYEFVYISGGSMSPTLTGSTISTSSYGIDVEQEGSTVDFGIMDTHNTAKNNIKRFTIVSTYFPKDYDDNGTLIANSTQKIKRVIALPGETFKIEESKLYIKNGDDFEYVPYTFETIPAVEASYKDKDISEVTLGNDEYWVLGDHRDNSRDCGSLYKESADVHKAAIKKSYLIGVLIAIEGQAKLKLTSCYCENCKKTYSSGVICANCGLKLTREFELTNKQYHWPKYY